MTVMTTTKGRTNLPRFVMPVFRKGDVTPVGVLLQLFEKARFWLHRNTRAQAIFQRGRCDVTRITVTRPA